MERALRIKSLENSPVNDRQLHVLRMVYDEITMYPSEAWMVLIAIVINRCVIVVSTRASEIPSQNLQSF